MDATIFPHFTKNLKTKRQTMKNKLIELAEGERRKLLKLVNIEKSRLEISQNPTLKALETIIILQKKISNEK